MAGRKSKRKEDESNYVARESARQNEEDTKSQRERAKAGGRIAKHTQDPVYAARLKSWKGETSRD